MEWDFFRNEKFVKFQGFKIVFCVKGYFILRVLNVFMY